ncbi:MAG: hypothetical protein H6557_10605 [Lewinellaceae bacterium]|nr:hypothetical protein [Phaeodactylibacter sp.]MCB9037058.1 hypothetical protein [Lewinellaceae bacterium]
MARSFSLFVLSALALAAISALLRAQTPGRLLAEAGAQAAFTFDSSGLYSVILTVSIPAGTALPIPYR